MENKPKKKLKDLDLFNVEKIEIKGNRVKPTNDFIPFRKEEIHQSIGSCFEQRNKKNADRVAVKCNDMSITYGFLNSYANRVAYRLRHEYENHQSLKKEEKEERTGTPGTDTEPSEKNERVLHGEPGGRDWQAVALLFGQGIEMTAGLLGALKSGKAYVPLDPTYPLERLEYMLADCEARVILTEKSHYSLAAALRARVDENIKIIDIGESNSGDITPEIPGVSEHDVAYVLYTSGSTGVPKGVMQSHRNVLHFARVYSNGLHIHAEDRITQFSSYSFDAAKMDIYGALLNGAALYPFDIKQESSLDRLPGWIKKERITIYHSIPTLFRYFVNRLNPGPGSGQVAPGPHPVSPGLRFIVLGGEAVYEKDVEAYKKYFPRDCIFINGLGPTESTVTLQYFIDNHTPLMREAVPVGYPAEETEVFILDKNGEEAVVNAVGEIVYKSDYLALGYLKKPGKTTEVFVKDPRPGKGDGRVYRSGDLGKRLEDGTIEYVGRKDSQVKVRGYRIELGEIETILLKHDDIREAAVIVKGVETGNTHLYAYIVPRHPLGLTELRGYLSSKLPGYMIPSYFIPMEKLPQTPSGKIDRKSLQEQKTDHLSLKATYVAPQTAVEKTIVSVWQEVLQLEEVGVRDNFFDLGGNSLDILKMSDRLQEALEMDIPLVNLFKYPTIALLARSLKPADEDEAPLDDAACQELKLSTERTRGKNSLKEISRRRRIG